MAAEQRLQKKALGIVQDAERLEVYRSAEETAERRRGMLEDRSYRRARPYTGLVPARHQLVVGRPDGGGIEDLNTAG